MKIITNQDILDLGIDYSQYYQWAVDMIKLKKNAILPPKISMKWNEYNFFNVMPCILPFENAMGVKMVSRYPNRKSKIDGEIILYDLETGCRKAILDAALITNIRTGAVAAHSIMLFAKKNFSSIGIIGLGNVSTYTLKILASVCDKNVNINLYTYKDQVEKFKKEFSHVEKFKFFECSSYDEIVINSDVIVSGVTYASKNFVKNDNIFPEGCLLVPIHTLGFQNCDLFFDKIFGDDYGHIEKFKYFDKFRYFSEVSDVVNGCSIGRCDDKERIIVYNIGLAIHDIYFANKIYDLMTK